MVVGGFIYACPSIVSGGKSDSTVSNSFPLRAARARRERPGWQMTPNICVTQPLQMRDFASQSLSLSVYGTLPLSSHYLYFWHNIKNDRLPVKITLKWLITIILFKVEIFPPFQPLIKSNDYEMIWNSSQRIKQKDHLVSSTSPELIILRFKFQIKKEIIAIKFWVHYWLITLMFVWKCIHTLKYP